MKKNTFAAPKKNGSSSTIPIASGTVLGAVIIDENKFTIQPDGFLSLKAITSISSNVGAEIDFSTYNNDAQQSKYARLNSVTGADYGLKVFHTGAIDYDNEIGGRSAIVLQSSISGIGVTENETGIPVSRAGTSGIVLYVEDIETGNSRQLSFGMDGLFLDGSELGLTPYIPEIATTSSIGLVKGNGNITIAADGTLNYSGPANSSITNAKLANMAQNTMKGRITASTGAPEDLNATQIRTLLNVADGANNYVHPTGDGNRHVPATSTTNNGKFLKSGATAASEAWASILASDVVYTPDANTTGATSQAAIAAIGARTTAMEALMGIGANDADTVVTTMVEMLATFQTWSEGVNVATIVNGKVTANAAITGATKAKITYDAKGLVTAGADLVEADIPTLSQSKISGLGTTLGLLAALASPTFTGTVTLPSTTSIGSVSSTELGYLDGVTSAIQTQLNNLAPKASPTFTTAATLPAATTIGTVTAAEIAYLSGVTSNIQSQLNTLASSVGANTTASVAMGASTVINHGNSLRLTKTIAANTTFTLTNPKGAHEVVLEVTGDFAVTITGASLIGGAWVAGKVNVYNIKCWDQNGTPVYHYTITRIL